MFSCGLEKEKEKGVTNHSSSFSSNFFVIFLRMSDCLNINIGIMGHVDSGKTSLGIIISINF